jgi:hypothetical protein
MAEVLSSLDVSLSFGSRRRHRLHSCRPNTSEYAKKLIKYGSLNGNILLKDPVK